MRVTERFMLEEGGWLAVTYAGVASITLHPLSHTELCSLAHDCRAFSYAFGEISRA
jgi:hypothetical protein